MKKLDILGNLWLWGDVFVQSRPVCNNPDPQGWLKVRPGFDKWFLSLPKGSALDSRQGRQIFREQDGSNSS